MNFGVPYILGGLWRAALAAYYNTPVLCFSTKRAKVKTFFLNLFSRGSDAR